MQQTYPSYGALQAQLQLGRGLLAALLLLLPLLGLAQPTVTRASLSPAANARTAPVGTTVQVPFSQDIDPATAGSIKVFSQQYRGRRTATASTSGSTVTLTPTASSGMADFRPGETVLVSVPATVQSTGGTAATRHVYQFTTATAGSGVGNFLAPATNPNPVVGGTPNGVALGDVDGDGDLDFVTANYDPGTVSVRLNNGSGNFTAPNTSPTSSVDYEPINVVLGDVDGDGDLDLLTANFGPGTVSVRLNDGSGNFSGTTNVAVGSLPRNVVLGDVDGDGDLDFVTANYGSNNVSVRLNNGSGVFSGTTNVVVGTNPVNVALGDVDGDGDLDFVTSNTGSNTVSVRLNNGSGTFTVPATNPEPTVGANPNGVALGDVDGDGDLDLLTTNYNGASVSVRLNNGSGNFSGTATVTVGSQPNAIALGDVDGDGDLDFATTNYNSSNVSVRLNNGTGTFTAPATNGTVAVQNYPFGVALGDVDGDGDLDLLAANQGSSTVSLRLNQPPAPAITSFTPTTGIAGTTLSLTGTDLTGATAITFSGSSGNVVTSGFTVVSSTSITDIVVPAGAVTGPLRVTTPGGASGASAQTFTVPFMVTALSPARNATAAAPTATVGVTFSQSINSATAGTIRVFSQQYRGRRTATASTSGSTVTLTPTASSGTADFRPGETVLVSVPATVQSTGGTAATRHVYQFTTATAGSGRGDFVAPATSPNPSVGSLPSSVAVGDVDGDGDLDLLTANSNTTGTVSVRLNDGSGNFSGTTSVAVGSQPSSVALGDVDGDGDLDFVTANYISSGTVSVRLNNGSGAFSGTTNVAVGTQPLSVALGDVDGDGDLDLLTANSGNNTVSVRLNNGSGTFSGTTNVAVGAGPRNVVLGDVDGDGDLDFVTANFSSGTVSVGLNNGSGVFSGITSMTVGSQPSSVALGDVDGDGDLDLLAANYGSNTVSLRLNDGTGTFTAPATNPEPAMGNRPYSVALGDVDGDGDLDLLTANSNTTGTVSVRLNQPPAPAITSFTPTSGPAGTTLSLTGINLTGATAITFSGTSDNVVTSGFTVASSTSITGIVVPAGAVTGPLTVTTPNGTSAASSTAFTVAPGLGSLVLSAGTLTPAFAPGTLSYTLTVPGTATATTVTPTNAQPSGGTITVNGTPVASGTAAGSLALAPGSNPITVVVNPAGAGSATTYTVTVTRTPCVVTATAQNLTVQLAANGTATITAAQVNDGSSSTCGAVSLSLDKTSFNCADLGDNSVTLTVTDGFGGSSTATATVTITAPPTATLTSASPNPATVGSTVTVTGTNLGEATALTVNGASAAISSLSATGFSFVVPGGAASTGNLVLTAPCGQSATLPFGVRPTISSFTPTSGPVGTTLTLTGTGLTGTTAITFTGSSGNVVTTGFTVASATSITGIVVPGGAQTGTLTVTTSGGASAASSTTFTVIPRPAITSFTPTSGPVGTSLNLTGTNLTGATAITFSGTSGNAVTTGFTVASATSITGIVVPAGAQTGTLTVTTPGGTSAASSPSFNVSPQLSSLVLSAGTLSPAFTPGTLSYTLTVPGSTTATTVTPTNAQTSGGTITVNGTAVASGAASGSIALNPGSTSIAVVVNPAGAGSATTYTVTVTRPSCVVTAQAQDVIADLDASGTVAVTGALIDNGSSSTCGPVTLSVSPTSFGCAVATTPAPTNPVLAFNSQYAEGTNALLPQGNAARTLETWVYRSGGSGFQVLLNYGTATTNLRASLMLNGSGQLYYAGENNDLTGGPVLALNTWNHVAATFDGTTLRLYVNGTQINSQAKTFNTTGTTWRIARRVVPGGTEYFNGRLDEVRVWDRALSAAEVAQSAARLNPAGLSGLVARWDMREGTGTSLADATGNSSPGTLYNTPTWLTPGIAYANPVVLTAANGTGGSATANGSVLVQDTSAPTAGVSLPAAPALALSNVPEAADYGLLYQLDMQTNNNFGALPTVPYTVNNSATTLPANPTRVAYFMELDNGSGSKWVWASMDNFAANLTQLGLPHRLANPVAWHRSVTNLSVFSNNGGSLVTGSNLGTGRIEMWPSDYTAANADAVTGASGSTFDFGDGGFSTSNGYGSFQVHNLTDRQTVLAYNAWHKGDVDEMGIGNQPSGNPDWTFAANAGSYTVKRLYILVPNPGRFVQPATVELDASGAATVTAAQVYRGNATDNCGTVNVSVSPSSFSCANLGPNTVTVTLSDDRGNTSSQTTTVTVATPPTATSTTWDGSASTAWTDCANWSYGLVPTATISAVLPAGMPNYPSLGAGTYEVMDLTVASGAALTTDAATTLRLTGNYTNNGGTLTLLGPVVFAGSAASQTVGGSAVTSFRAVTVDKASGNLSLAQDMYVNTSLTMTSGLLTTGPAHKVTLRSIATLAETDASYVSGTVENSQSLYTAGTGSNFSGIGLTLTPAAGSVAVPGYTVVRRVTGSPATGVNSSSGIARYFDIQPLTNANLDLTLTLRYREGELNGIAENKLLLFKSESGAAGPWARVDYASYDATTNTVTRDHIARLSVWTLGNADAPLPVELTSFTATAEGQAARLRWTTASEQNSAYFDIERSLDGKEFAKIGEEKAQGTKASPTDYTFLDFTIPPTHQSTSYYRLRQVDLDGTASYSPVRVVTVGGKGSLTLYPNPARTAVTVAGLRANAAVEVLDALGRPVARATADAGGTASLTLPAGLAAGVYIVRSGAQAQRLTVE